MGQSGEYGAKAAQSTAAEDHWTAPRRPADQDLTSKALRAAYEEAKAGSRAKTAFLASISHELRTPLNGIMGFAQMIARNELGTNCDPRYAEYAEHILMSSQKLLNVLNDIMDMARLEGGRMQVQRELLVLPDVLIEAMAVVRQRLPNAVTPETRIDAQFPELWIDRRHLRQILVNVLSNALAFNRADGKVALAAHIGPGGDAEIAISDMGKGMSPEELKRAVTRFGHAEGEERRRSGGIGLGIPLAKSLTELLGGNFRIASELGQGTTVTIAFPIDTIRERAFEWKKAPDRMEERRRRLLGQPGN